ncbi:rho GTPase-activating protein gacII [Jatropha curcas]|uniref:rho GTPase-activating protein gacII n=1 Tax=Jatropha curcas TaxID=180498 RepID=UPI0005FB428F|nr:rho GTPase-activating protein gacII [Jatropha curcas]
MVRGLFILFFTNTLLSKDKVKAITKPNAVFSFADQSFKDNFGGSMQSSSGGDEEYDSRAESISVFLNNNNNPLTHVGPMSNPPPPPPPADHHHHQTHHSSSSSTMFDPLSNYFDPSSSSTRSLPSQLTNPFLNLDMVWSKNLRSETNCTDLSALIDSSSPTQQFLTNQSQNKPHFPSVQIPQPSETTLRPSASTSTDQTTTNIGRNPKKRSRASRRAPTTVLTTDTTNFRAMVQEFTGIPAPPFTSTSFQRTRLDLFGTSSLRSASTHFDPSPSPNYLLRPAAQKIQTPFSSSSSTNNNTCSHSPQNINTNLLDINLQNPIFNLHSLLPKYPLGNSSIIGSTKPQQEMGVIQEFGLSHGHGHVTSPTNLTGLQNIVTSPDATLRRNDNWGGDGVISLGSGGRGGGSNNESDQQGLLRSINGNYSNNSARVSNSDKGTEINVATRSEGMVESWICSSD